MIRRASLLISLISLVLFGCTTTKSVMKSWVGHPIDDVVAAWGAPDSRMARTDGGAVYTWITVSGNQYGVQQCRQSFTTNAESVVTGWSYNNCPRLVPK